MKSISTFFFVSLMFAASFGLASFGTVPPPVQPTTTFYNVQFLGTQQVGSDYEWTWSVANPAPGNGSNGTLQDLSHWSLAIGNLVNPENVVAVQYGLDGLTWHLLPAALAIDRSQKCLRSAVLKFDYGTTGSAPTYYKLTVNKDFSIGITVANFKSGSKTGCYNGMVSGIGTSKEPATDR